MFLSGGFIQIPSFLEHPDVQFSNELVCYKLGFEDLIMAPINE